MIDLRSDTITKPTPEMRQAIFEAEVGDDVFGDDPSVNELEESVAKLLDKEAAVFMPSGTMANQVAIRCHTEPGDEVILDRSAHIFYYESGAPAALSGVSLNLVSSKRGIFKADDVSDILRPKGKWFSPSKLICIENTHNRGGGKIWPLEYIEDLAILAKTRDLKFHLDGARLWNASAATGIPESEYAKYFESLSVCFSKGLGAPVGSALCGSTDFIERARRFRSQFGGGMRQSGILAAAALYALENHRLRLKEDHANAYKLAEILQEHPKVKLKVLEVESNIVAFDIRVEAEKVAGLLYERGVWVIPIGNHRLRAVTHLHISSKDIEMAGQKFMQVLDEV